MAILNVDPNVYSASATSLNSAAAGLFTAFEAQMKALADTKDMGGSVGDCGDWAKSYDQVSQEACSLANTLVSALDNYAGILQQAGYNYAIADFAKGTGRAEPTVPTALPMAGISCLVPPPSAGGPGSGLVDDGFELASKVGIPVPDGDPDKLQVAADAWEALAKHPSVSSLAATIEAIATTFDAVTSPDATFIDEDLREMKVAAEEMCTTFSDISQSCRDQKAAVDDLRTQLKQLLSDLAADIAQEVATTVVFTVVAGALSAGFGAVAVAAYRAKKIAHKVDAYAGRIAGIIKNVKLLNKIPLKKPPVTTRDKLQRIVDMFKRARQLGVPERPSHVPSDWAVRLADDGKGWVWQKPGSDLNKDMFRIKLPDSQYPNGCVRFYNSGGQPIGLDGKPGGNPVTHIPINADGTYPLPKGW